MADRIDALIVGSNKNILLSMDEIRVHITLGSGEQFMPQLVEAF